MVGAKAGGVDAVRALMRAVRRGDADVVRACLASGVDPNVRRGRVPIVVAAEAGRSEIVELLVEAGADPTWLDDAGWSALTYADAGEFYDLADRLEELGAPGATRLAHGYSALHRAALRSDAVAVTELAHSVGTETLDAQGDTPLVLAVRSRSVACVEALLLAGANVGHVNEGWSVLAEAAYMDATLDQTTDFVERLIAAGADPNPAGYPPLFCAVNQDGSSAEVIRQLAEAGADVRTLAGYERETLLHRIAQIADGEEEVHLIDVVLELGADIEALDGAGRTPLLAAARSGNGGTFARLLELGANLSATDTTGLGAAGLVDDRDLDAAFIRELISRGAADHAKSG